MIKEKTRFNYKSLEFVVLAILIISMIIVYSIPTSKRAVPFGPIIGGDLYAHVGAVKSIRENWTPWIDQYYDSGIGRAYSWLWHVLIAALSFVIPLMTLLFWSPLVFWIISLIGIYFAGKILYGKKFGLLLAMLYFFMVEDSLLYPNPKNLLLVSFFLSIALTYKAFESKKIWHAVIAGIVMALTFMNYSMLIVLPAVPIIYVILNLILKRYSGDKKELLHDLKVAGIIVALAVIISIPYWLPIVTSINPKTVQSQSISASVEQHEGSPFFTRIYEIFFRFIFHDWYFIPFFIAGLFFIFTNFNKKSVLLIALLITLYLGRFHDYITRPLLGWEGVQPFYFPFFVNYTYWIIIVLGFLALLNKLVEIISKKIQGKSILSEHVEKTAILIILIIVLVLGNINTYEYLSVGPDSWKSFVAASYQPLPRMFTEPAKWISQNTNDKDVIIAHPFYAYGIFGLTGRHIYASMYGHMLSLLDDNDRRRDAQEIYTTSNITRTLDLLAKRKATYLIIDPYAADKSQWFQVDHWDVIEGKKPMPQDERNITKFFNNSHFESVYNYTEIINNQNMLLISIFKIKY